MSISISSGVTSSVPPAGPPGGFTVLSGGSLQVLAGGAASATVVSGGSVTVGVGGVASGSLVAQGVLQVSGGAAVATTVTSGGQLDIYGGTATGDVISGGFEVIYAQSPSVASGSLVEAGGQQYVYVGSSIAAFIGSGGEQFVEGGTTSAATVASSGTQNVSAGAVATDDVVLAGGTVNDAGLLLFTEAAGSTVLPLGILAGTGSIENAGAGTLVLATDVSIFHGAVEIAGGTVQLGSATAAGTGPLIFVDDTVGTLTIEGGALPSNPISGFFAGDAIDLAGVRYVSGGSATVSGDTVTVTEGGASYALTIVGAAQDGNFALTQAPDGSTLLTDTLVVTYVTSGVTSTISAGSTASGLVVLSGGVLQVLSGGTASNTTILGGGVLLVSGGTDVGTVISSGGSATIFAGGSGVSEVISSGGVETVAPGGATSGNTIMGGIEVVDAGALASGSLVIEGALVLSGGTASATLVGYGAQLEMYGGLAVGDVISGGIEVFNSGYQSVASGSTIEAGGQQYLYAGAVVSASVGNLGYQVVEGGTASATTVGSGGSQNISSGSVAIDDSIASGGAVNLAGSLVFTVSAGATVALAGTLTGPGTVAVSGGGTLSLPPNTSGFTGTIQPGQGTVVSTPCYCRGTMIATEHGEAAVEALAIGDTVRTAGGTLRPVRWIGRRSYAGRFIAGNRDILPILIRAGALADRLPSRDLYVSPKHAMFIDGVLIPAERLVNGRSILQLTEVDELAYFHIELDSHDVLLAEGAPAESFVDCDSRLMFQNAADFAGTAVSWQFCAERIESGPMLEAVRRRLATRVGLAACHAEDAAAPGLPEARIDAVDQDGITGWAFDPARPHTPLALDILVDGVVVGSVVANAPRADLADAGKGRGWCAFTFGFAAPLARDAAHILTLRAGDHPLAIEMLAADPAPLAGRIDVCDDQCVEGWAFDPTAAEHPVLLSVLLDGRVIGQTPANRFRLDLAVAGFGDGRCAFRFDLSGYTGHEVAVRRTGDAALLGVALLTASQQRLPGESATAR